MNPFAFSLLLVLVLLLPVPAVLTEEPPPPPTKPPSSPPSPSSPPNATQPLRHLATQSPPPPPPTTTTTTTTTITTRTSPPPPPPPTTTTTTGRSTCPEIDQIHCGTNDRCTRIRYICDGDNDCGDSSDEDSSLCAAWRNNDCDRNLVRCTRMGRSDCVTISSYCTLTNPPCEGTLDMRLCVMLREGKIQPLHTITLPTTTPNTTPMPTTHLPLHVIEDLWTEGFEEKLSHTISHPDCPQLYTLVGNLCISVFFIGNMTWLESRAFCRAIGGDLFTLKENISSFATLLQHMTSNGVTADFWVGGRFVNETDGWKWVDNTRLTMGSPFWAVRYNQQCSTRNIQYMKNSTQMANDGACYHYQQAPPENTGRHCLAATYRHYFYLTDEDCFSKKSPLCVLPGEKKKQAL